MIPKSSHIPRSFISVLIQETYEPWHEISNKVVCATSTADQPAHMCSRTRAFANCLNILWMFSYWQHHLVFLSLKGSCTGSSESTLVKMPCWKSHVATQCRFFYLLLWQSSCWVEQNKFWQFWQRALYKETVLRLGETLKHFQAFK